MEIKLIKHANTRLEHIHIQNDTVSSRIYPNLGASMQELCINGEHIIDGITNDQNGLEDYDSTYKSSILFPFPNRIKDGNYSISDTSYNLKINEKALNNALHGIVYDKHFSIVSTASINENANIVLSYSFDGSLPGFPFPFELTLRYQISETGNVELDFQVKNTGETPFPMGMGWHPYFISNKQEECKFSFPSKDHFRCDKRNIPVETVPTNLPASFVMQDKELDDAYSLDKASCYVETGKYQLELDFDYSGPAYLQLYTPPHKKSIAIEPMTCVANSFNNKIGLKYLSPKKTDHWAIKLGVRTT